MQEVIEFFITANTLAFLFSLPFLVARWMRGGGINLFYLYLVGSVNLIFCIFGYCSINYFVDIRKINIVGWTAAMVLIESAAVILAGQKQKLDTLSRKRKFAFDHGWWFLIVFLVSFGCFYFLNTKYFDSKENKSFNPGYGINHDQIIVLGSAKAFFKLDEHSGRLVKLLYEHCKWLGYPQGGTFINVFFAQLNGLDVYFNYQRVIVWLGLLTIFVINYFALEYFGKINIWLRAGVLMVSVISVMNYLSLSFINSSVFGSTASTPFLFLAILLTVGYIKTKKEVMWFWPVMAMTIINIIFIYTYIATLFYCLFLISAFVIYGWRSKEVRRTIFKLSMLVILVFMIPINLVQASKLLKVQLTSDLKEYNVLSRQMYGNTIGFVNPMTAFSIWTSNADYRFFDANYHNTELFFTLIGLFGMLLIYLPGRKEEKNLALALILPFMFMVGLTYWITKSSYQNSKAMSWFGDIWPLVMLLLLTGGLVSRKLGVKLMTLTYLGVYSYIALRSGILTTNYVGKPLVSSSHELMAIENEVCQSDKKTLFLGRDENSKYFLITCKDMTFYYDRFDNNPAFWEVIHLNNLNPTAACNNGDYKLTPIYYVGYERVLVDKCFKFDIKDYRLIKEYKNYDYYERVSE
ncbi:MAG: hypothetical protein WC686_01500 [Candidatus Shapirobacteria bacterium]|jgi:hypothetical protein